MMHIVLWVVAALLVLTLLPSLLYVVLFWFTQEPVAKRRAQMFWNWAVLASLLGIIAYVYERLAQTIVELF